MSDEVYYPKQLDKRQIENLKKTREAFAKLDKIICSLIPQGRYMALMKTALEMAALWASKAISHEWKEKSK